MKDKPIVRTQVAGFSNTLTRLQVGMIVEFAGFCCEVVFVSDCRAHVVPLSRKSVEIKTLEGAEVRFERPQKGYDISPNAEILIIRYKQP